MSASKSKVMFFYLHPAASSRNFVPVNTIMTTGQNFHHHLSTLHIPQQSLLVTSQKPPLERVREVFSDSPASCLGHESRGQGGWEAGTQDLEGIKYGGSRKTQGASRVQAQVGAEGGAIWMSPSPPDPPALSWVPPEGSHLCFAKPHRTSGH